VLPTTNYCLWIAASAAAEPAPIANSTSGIQSRAVASVKADASGAAIRHCTSAGRRTASPQSTLIRGDELRMLRELQRNTTGAFIFETERGGPFTADAVNRLVKTIGARAKLSFGVHAHMLRHACGYALANAGHDTRLIQDWLGHRAIQHTARYTELSPTRFKDVWR